MAKVLRIQHTEDGSGPFSSMHPSVRGVVDSAKIPQPLDDIGFDEKAIARLQDEKASPTKFGFKDEKQMGKTFTPEHLATLKEHGYEPKWVDAKDTWSSKHQTFFTTHEGDKLHAKKAAEHEKQSNYKKYSKEEVAAMNAERGLNKIKGLLTRAQDLKKAIIKIGTQKEEEAKRAAEKAKTPKERAAERVKRDTAGASKNKGPLNIADRDKAIAKDKAKKAKKASEGVDIAAVKRAQIVSAGAKDRATVTADSIRAEKKARAAKIQSAKAKQDNHQAVLDKLKDPKARAAALAENNKKHTDEVNSKKSAKRSEEREAATYKRGVNRNDGNSEPVATRKRTGGYIAQNKRRKDANDNKLINKETNQQIKDLSKGMKNSGIGGKGAVKLGAVKPSIKAVSLKQPGSTNSSTPSIGKAPASKKDSMLAAQQIQNKDIKDIKMKEAQAHMVKFEKNGQWSMQKADDVSVKHTGSDKNNHNFDVHHNGKKIGQLHSMVGDPSGIGGDLGDTDFNGSVSDKAHKLVTEQVKEKGLNRNGLKLVKFQKNGQWSMEKADDDQGMVEMQYKGSHKDQAKAYLKVARTEAEAGRPKNAKAALQNHKEHMEAHDAQVGSRMANNKELASLKAKSNKIKDIGQKLGSKEATRIDYHKDQKAASDNDMSYDNASDKVIQSATVNGARHKGADINIADKQPSQIRE